jgi:hypothetical protein
MNSEITTITSAQAKWLRHMIATGNVRTVPANTYRVLTTKGLIERKLGAIYVVTDAGREALAAFEAHAFRYGA